MTLVPNSLHARGNTYFAYESIADGLNLVFCVLHVVQVYFDEITRLSNNTVDLRGITMDEGEQLPVFLDGKFVQERRTQIGVLNNCAYLNHF